MPWDSSTPGPPSLFHRSKARAFKLLGKKETAVGVVWVGKQRDDLPKAHSVLVVWPHVWAGTVLSCVLPYPPNPKEKGRWVALKWILVIPTHPLLVGYDNPRWS